MEYVIITALYILGLAYHAMKVVSVVKAVHKESSFAQVWSTYFKSEWNTLMVAGLGLITVNIIWYALHRAGVQLPDWLHEYGGIYIGSVFLGYWLHRGIYAILGTLEQKAEQRFGGGQK